MRNKRANQNGMKKKRNDVVMASVCVLCLCVCLCAVRNMYNRKEVEFVDRFGPPQPRMAGEEE